MSNLYASYEILLPSRKRSFFMIYSGVTPKKPISTVSPAASVKFTPENTKRSPRIAAMSKP